MSLSCPCVCAWPFLTRRYFRRKNLVGRSRREKGGQFIQCVTSASGSKIPATKRHPRHNQRHTVSFMTPHDDLLLSSAEIAVLPISCEFSRAIARSFTTLYVLLHVLLFLSAKLSKSRTWTFSISISTMSTWRSSPTSKR